MAADTQNKPAQTVANAAITELEGICNLLRTRCVQHAMHNEALTADNADLRGSLKAALDEIETLKSAARAAQSDGV